MNRLIVVSNRLPFALDSTGEDLWTVTPAVGGLVSAVEPVLRERGGTWIGWPGVAGEIPQEPLRTTGRFHLGARLPPHVRCSGTARAWPVPKTFGIDVFPAHPLSAVRYFFEAPATTAAPARVASVRFGRVPDATRRPQFSPVRAARDVRRKSSFSSRATTDSIQR